MLRKRRVKFPIFTLAGLVIATAVGLTSAPIPVVAQSVQHDQQIPPKFDVGPIPQSILDVNYLASPDPSPPATPVPHRIGT